ncbi:nitroreductase family deazaflavin-dependent oxidoreductase [Actinorugispora endophytica]|nr:nitroreductase family deazaflavin-dependent oxidoreductase [Actinorugispora endophytica]
MLFRLPVHLYRMRLGRLLGGRLLLLEHTGRVSGKRRLVVVEVVERDAGGGYTVCSGFGAGADWYRNVLAAPETTVRVGGRVVRVTGVPLSSGDGGEAMVRYARRHPVAARRLSGFMGFVVDGSEGDYREVGRRLPFVRFVPRR